MELKEKLKIDRVGEIKLVIDYDKSIKQAILEGRYDWKDGRISLDQLPYIPKNQRGKKEVFIKFFSFDTVRSLKEIILKMAEEGYYPGNFFELLAVGYSSPDLQRQFPIVGLGSVLHDHLGHCFVPCLSTYGDTSRRLNAWPVDDWTIRYRFLGIRKS